MYAIIAKEDKKALEDGYKYFNVDEPDLSFPREEITCCDPEVTDDLKEKYYYTL